MLVKGEWIYKEQEMLYLTIAIWGLLGTFAMVVAIIYNIRTSEWWNAE